MIRVLPRLITPVRFDPLTRNEDHLTAALHSVKPEDRIPYVPKLQKEIRMCPMNSILTFESLRELEATPSVLELRQKLVNEMEQAYFSVSDVGANPYFEGFSEFRQVVQDLDVHFKLDLMQVPLVAPPRTPRNPQKKWMAIQPVDMEEWEKRRYEKSQRKVKIIRDIEVTPIKMTPGKRLRSILGFQVGVNSDKYEFPDLLRVAALFLGDRVVRGHLHTVIESQVFEALQGGYASRMLSPEELSQLVEVLPSGPTHLKVRPLMARLFEDVLSVWAGTPSYNLMILKVCQKRSLWPISRRKILRVFAPLQGDDLESVCQLMLITGYYPEAWMARLRADHSSPGLGLLVSKYETLDGE